MCGFFPFLRALPAPLHGIVRFPSYGFLQPQSQQNVYDIPGTFSIGCPPVRSGNAARKSAAQEMRAPRWRPRVRAGNNDMEPNSLCRNRPDLTNGRHSERPSERPAARRDRYRGAAIDQDHLCRTTHNLKQLIPEMLPGGTSGTKTRSPPQRHLVGQLLVRPRKVGLCRFQFWSRVAIRC